MIAVEPYEGYYKAFNLMAKMIGGEADVIITGGDDISPVMEKTAQEIALECFQKFPDGFFVMQPTGDDMPGVHNICASPWFGKGWIKRAYQGMHPVWPDYVAFYGDEELKEVAWRLKVLWQRDDLVQYHHHWARRGGPAKTDYQAANDKWWDHDKAIFVKRKSQNFPKMWPVPPETGK